MGDSPQEVTLPNLAERVSIIEQRLGIDPVAVTAESAASLAAGAEAHVGNVQSDVPTPAVPESPEDAIAAVTVALDEDDAHKALDHVNKALEKWPTDEDLLAAKSDIEADIAADEAKAAEAEPTS